MILFLLYFLKLRLSVLFGFHKTANPLDFKWRWNKWKKTRHIRKEFVGSYESRMEIFRRVRDEIRDWLGKFADEN